MRGKGLRSRLATKLGRKVAVRMVGVVVATAGLALLGVGTISSPLAGGHVKLAAFTPVEGGNDNCHGQEAPVLGDEGVQKTCTTTTSNSSSSSAGEGGDDNCQGQEGDNAPIVFGDDETTCTTSSKSSSSSSSSSKTTKSCHTVEEDAVVSDDDTTCTTSSSSSSSSSSSHSSSSAVSTPTSSGVDGGSTSTMTTAVLGVATATPSTGADVEFGAGLALMFAGGGLVAAGARLGRKQGS